MKRWNKSGQFYLAAAIVIILVIVGFVGVSNYLEKSEPVRIYDLKEELGIESGQVLDHGIYNEKNYSEMNDLLQSFSEDYSNYVEEGYDLYFVFGNENQLVIAGFKDLVAGTIGYEHGQSGFSELEIRRGVYNSTKVENPERQVKINVGNREYPFELKSRDNFYFVISQETEEGEIFTEVGE
jgi:hypothetical protein